ncbi:MAG: c-type cytochrome domain-containing protein, partial [Planctomycetota bacterium]
MLLIVVLAYPSCFAADREAIDFANDVQPIFARNCVACHNDNLAEGGLNLESHAALVKGGDSGESFVAGQPESSYLLSRVNGDEEPWMPPEDNAVGANRLTPAELEIIESWIEQGATVGSPATKSMIRLKPPPSRLQPTYDMEFAPDGSFLTYGRGSTAYVLPVHRSHIGKLPSAKSTPLLESESAETTTHLDLVQSIAVSPDSQRIATGGYKQVKLWRQKRIQSEFMSDLVHAGKRFTLSPDGRHLAYQTGDSTFEIVHLERGVSQRYLKTHQQPLATLAWIDDANLLTYDHRGNCSTTKIDGNQESYDLHSDSVGVALAAEFVDQWLYVAHGNGSGKVNLSRRSIATPDISSEWNTVVADLAVAD